MKRFILLALAVGVLGGCSSHPSPKLTVAHAAVGAQSDAGTVVNITLNAANTGPKAVPLRDVRYSVRVEGGPEFEGVRSAQTTLNRYGTATIVLPAAFTSPIPAGARLIVSGTVVYVPPGTISQTLLEAEIVEPTVSFGAPVELSPG
ncbi:MAG: hypothetical protein HUU18_06725 [Phycisphaerales bacterium]|jgi:hypothetical protein|nr:hypothetical protein [Phycisphaerales bacterium]NUQ67957.1 hypothetical protein [Phycisphaerales bacterium]